MITERNIFYYIKKTLINFDKNENHPENCPLTNNDHIFLGKYCHHLEKSKKVHNYFLLF
jgi:hypothetical protein